MRRRAFTLVELLITITIIGVMAGAMLFALWGAQEQARIQKTRTLITKLDGIIKAKWEAYETRRVPIVIPPGATRTVAAKTRLDGLRDLMRMELPDRFTDIIDPPLTAVPRSSASNAYLRRYNAVVSPTGEFAGAECLYLIVTAAMSEDADGTDVFRPDDSADVDGDGLREFVDGWGQPIKFLRWPAGFQFSELQIVFQGTANGSAGSATLHGFDTSNPLDQPMSKAAGAYIGGSIMAVNVATGDAFQPANWATITGYTFPTAAYFQSVSFSGRIAVLAPDPFDPTGVYSQTATPGFATYPLIYSSGPDKCYGIMADFDSVATLHYAQSPANLSPFYAKTDGVSGNVSLIGCARNDPGETNYAPEAWIDNIHNHLLGTK